MLKTTQIEVPNSGDMAFVIGTYKSTNTDATGKQVTEHGEYLEVWERDNDGTWKCGADSLSRDSPAKS